MSKSNQASSPVRGSVHDVMMQ